MSLVGSLEDLGLGDILQIVSLSRKSGVLRLRCEGGEGRIVLQDGMVSGAAIKGRFEDACELLVAGEHASAEAVDAALQELSTPGRTLADALSARGLVTPEQLEGICRTGVESAVMEMFGWRAGEFTFEVREAVDGSEAVLLETPLSSQYIAMEATRKRDEYAHFGEEPFEDDDQMLFSGEEPLADSPDPVDDLAMGTLERIEAEHEHDENESTLSLGHAPSVEAREASAAAEPPVSVEPERRAAESRGHLIAIDPDLGALEWLKATVGERFERIHIFQRAEIGVDRIRHYLGRGVVPAVLVASTANAERPGGAPELVSRLRALAPSMHVAVLFDEGQQPEVGFEAADGVLFRPVAPGTDPEKWGRYESAATVLHDSLLSMLDARAPAARAGTPPRHPALVRLKQTSDQLRDPTSDRDILALVLDFAAENFSRVAMFMIREERVDTIAQRGLDRAGGPPQEELAVVSFGPDDQPEIFRRVLDRRAAIVSTMAGEGDERLGLMLGTAVSRQAYVAPIESGGEVVALLYADDLPEDRSLPDTTALEIVLHEAGMALDRALLRRTVAELEARA